jgi:hypothetical protein
MPVVTGFYATVGACYVESAATFRQLVQLVGELYAPEQGEDVCFWEGNRLLEVWMSDGRRLKMRCGVCCPDPDGPRAA